MPAFVPQYIPKLTTGSKTLFLGQKTGLPFSASLSSCSQRVSKRACFLACSDQQSGAAPDDASTSAEKEQEELIKALDAKPLRWSEIPFASIHEELDAIDEYVREEDVNDNDPWPKFLRGAAYEYWGQPQLALAQYAKTSHAGGLRRIPELWERRAYNCFKLGKVAAAHSYFEISLGLYYESCGNELHIVHWFYENFTDYLPKWNGPAAPIQRGICKYCFGDPEKARSCFMPQIATLEKEVDHALLWFLASAAKASNSAGLRTIDENVVADALSDGVKWSPRLELFFKLYYAAARGEYDRVAESENELSESIKADKSDDICTHLYTALYHDAFTKDFAERDRALDIVQAIGCPPSTHDVENFLFFTAKNRLSVPADGTDPDVPERRPY